MTDPDGLTARLRELRNRITVWGDDDNTGYDQAIKLLGHIRDELDALLATLVFGGS